MKKKFIITFIISLVLFGGIFWVANRILDVMELTSKVEFVGNDLGEGNNIEQRVENELLFLVLGLDSDDFSGATTEQNRTDTMILAKVNFETGKIDMLSIPRDSRVMVNGKLDKINHAHHYGGLKMAMKTTRDFLNLDIDYYVRVNFFSVKDIVDVLGGIEVDVPVQVDVAEDNIHLKPGKQILNGKQALQFARFRAGYTEGDLGRVKSQQLIIKALIKELTKAKNIAKLPEILEVVKKTVNTNIPFSTIAKLSLKVKNLGEDKMHTEIVPGEAEYIHNTSYYIPNRTKLNALVKEMFGEYLINKQNGNSQVDTEKNNNNIGFISKTEVQDGYYYGNRNRHYYYDDQFSNKRSIDYIEIHEKEFFIEYNGTRLNIERKEIVDDKGGLVKDTVIFNNLAAYTATKEKFDTERYAPIANSIEKELSSLQDFRTKIEKPYNENLFAQQSFKEIITTKIEAEKKKLEDLKLELAKQKNRYEK